MKSKHKYHQKLDDFLKFVVTKEILPINKIKYVPTTLEEMDDELERTVEKLKKDNLIKEPATGTYKATYDGMLFFEKGGYVQQLKTERNNRYYILIKEYILIIGSTIGGFYALLKIIEFFSK